jgi:type IV pilus assembly protein PilM
MAALKGASGPFLGLDIGASYIKAVEVRLARGRAEVTGLGVLPTPTGLMDNNLVLDPQALGQVIKQFLSKSGISSKRVVSSVAGQSSLVVRIIPVPKMTRAELNETMKWEIERHVPFPANETVWDFQPLTPPESTPDNENMQVLLAVAQEALVNAHVEALMAAGLQPVAIDVEPLAASRALLDLAGADGAAAGVVAVVDMGSIASDISIFRDGVISFTRTMPIAGRTFTQAISEMTGQPLDHAERLKKDLARVPEGIAPVVQPDFGDQFGGFGAFGDEPAADYSAGGAVDTTAPPGGPLDFAAGGFAGGGFADTTEGPVFDLGAPSDEEPGAGQRPAFDLSEGGGAEFDLGETTGEFTAPTSYSSVPARAPLGEVDEDYMRQQVNDAITPILGELVTELRRSLDYYRNNTGQGAERMILCGGTAKLPGLERFLGEQLGIPVEVGDPMSNVTVAAKTEPAYLADVSPIFSVSLGLAVREMLTNGADTRQKTKGRK